MKKKDELAGLSEEGRKINIYVILYKTFLFSQLEVPANCMRIDRRAVDQFQLQGKEGEVQAPVNRWKAEGHPRDVMICESCVL